MASFPRTLLPNVITKMTVPSGLRSRSHSGAWQARSATQVGRSWQETWSILNPRDPTHASLIAWCEWAFAENHFVDLKHLLTPGSGLDPNGTGSAGVTVSGASQTGESLVTTGWPVSTSGVVKAGDVIKIAGFNIVHRIVSDANSDAGGNATLTINPKLYAGSSPANGAAITTTNVEFRCFIDEMSEFEGTVLVDKYADFTLKFVEVP